MHEKINEWTGLAVEGARFIFSPCYWLAWLGYFCSIKLIQIYTGEWQHHKKKPENIQN